MFNEQWLYITNQYEGGSLLKIKVFKELDFNKLNNIIPQWYKSLISALPNESIYDIAIFPNDKVILSGNAQKVVSKLGKNNDNRMLALGYCFTKETRLLFKENNIEIIELHEFHWTDESYTNIRQGIY